MTEATAAIRLKKNRDKPIRQRHPWLFSGGIQQIIGEPEPGDLVDILAADGRYLATGYYNPHSQIRVRVLRWADEPQVDRAFWRALLRQAIQARQQLKFGPQTTVFRLVNGEADRLPGLIVDRYNDYLVIQCLTLGIDRRKEMLVELLVELLHPTAVVERSDSDMRTKEGLPKTSGVLYGPKDIAPITVFENNHPFTVNLLEGHKTGFYIDQRENRALVGQEKYAGGRDVLNVFAYTGGFAVYAAAGGAKSITNIDTSIPALELAESNVIAAVGDRPQDSYLAGDAFQILRDYRDEGRQFDMIILDPPKFVHSQRDLNRATRGYKDINWLGFRLARPGALVATFSCSGLLSADLFQKIVFGAAVDAGRDVQILHHLWQGADHPILLSFPESAYLKGFLCRVR